LEKQDESYQLEEEAIAAASSDRRSSCSHISRLKKQEEPCQLVEEAYIAASADKKAAAATT
jgi:hypothetical protein